MADKVLFSRSCDIIPMRKGTYKDPMKDIAGFRLLVETTEQGEVSKGLSLIHI